MTPATSIPPAERYDRQMRLEGFGPEGQAKLARATVVVAGVGGLGSPQAIYLAAAGVGRLRLIDADTVSASNLNRQVLHGEADLGRPKVDSAREKLARLNSTVEVEAIRTRIDDASVDGLLAGADLVLDAMDNFAARRVLNRGCLRLGVPFIYGGIHGLTGMLAAFAPGRTACLECLFPNDVPAQVFPVVGTTPGVIGCLQATEAIKILVGLGRPLFDRLLIYNGLEMTFQEAQLERNPHCPACGRSEG